MCRLSNGIISVVNAVTIFTSLVCIGFSLWFYTHHHQGVTACQQVLQQPLLVLGLCLLVVSLVGLIGSCCQIRSLLVIYVVLMVLLIIGLIGFTLFTVVVTNKGVGKAVSGKGYKEYRLGDYSNWLQKYVVNEKNWEKFKVCLVDANVCSGLGGETADDFNKRRLSPTESGCCKPPTYCGFQFKNATFWTVPKGGPTSSDNTDCTKWSNDQSALCYDCKSCKAGVLANIKKQWRVLIGIDVAILIIVLLLCSIACCAVKKDRSTQYKSGYP